MTGERLAGRVALITGGASGMGLATARRFLAEGASVVVADLNEANGAAFLSDLAAGEDQARARFVPVDVSAEVDVEQAVSVAVSEFGHLDVVFNNAGVGGAFGPVTEIEVDDWDYTFAVLCRGVFLGIKHGARAMRAAGGGGSIINTASVAGLSGGAGPLAYSAAKAAVINLTRSAAVELAASRIRVNAICPGAVSGELMDKVIATRAKAENRPPEEIIRVNYTDKAALRRWVDPEDVAAAAVFLASDRSASITADRIRVDAGRM